MKRIICEKQLKIGSNYWLYDKSNEFYINNNTSIQCDESFTPLMPNKYFLKHIWANRSLFNKYVVIGPIDSISTPPDINFYWV